MIHYMERGPELHISTENDFLGTFSVYMTSEGEEGLVIKMYSGGTPVTRDCCKS